MDFSRGVLVGSQTDIVYEFRSCCGRYRYHKTKTNRGESFAVRKLGTDGEWFHLKKAKTRHQAEMACVVDEWNEKVGQDV